MAGEGEWGFRPEREEDVSVETQRFCEEIQGVSNRSLE